MRTALVALIGLTVALSRAESQPRRPIVPTDIYRIRTVGDPDISPDGQWVAFGVSTLDSAKDAEVGDIYMASWDGARTVRLTWGGDTQHLPKWSPDGHGLAFLSARGDGHDVDQLWVLSRDGGEAERVTDFPGGVSDYSWSPDGKRLAIIAGDAPDTGTRPIVIDRLQFKADGIGYLTEHRDRLYVYDLHARSATLLTPGPSDAYMPEWSPDGRTIAYVRKSGEDVDRSDNWDLYVVDADGHGAPKQLTTYDGMDNEPDWGSRIAWSPDGKSIAYTRAGDPKLIYYSMPHLFVVPAAGGEPRALTPDLDRIVTQPQWSADGSHLYFLVEDDRAVQLATVPAGGGKIERLDSARHVISALRVGHGDRVGLLVSTPDAPPELFAWEKGKLRVLTAQNAAWRAEVALVPVDETRVKSADGTSVSGFIVRPPGFQVGQRYPTILRIHGGPVMEFGDEFDFSWQLLAGHGYVVVAANPRGSSGRGEPYSKAIYADWGNKDSQDVLAVVDDAVARGFADSTRLGVGGHSYGGMLTDQTIARTTRFKAAIADAGQGNAFAGYGTDMYVREYETELGRPWEHPDVWQHNSYPFFHAAQIVTPTLFVCGDKDFNVPLLDSEQMYQALRSLGRTTELVIYPGQYHEFTRPSFIRDRYVRYLAWYDRFLLR